MRRRVFLAAVTGSLAGIAGCQGLGSIGVGGGREETYDVPPRERTERTTEAGTETPTITPGPQSAAVDGTTRSVLRRLSPSRRLALSGPPISSNRGSGRYVVGFASPPTAGSPATVSVQFTATGERTREYEFGPSPPFSNYWGRPVNGSSGERSFLLVPNDGRPFPYGDLIPETPRDGRWVATDRTGAPESDPETPTVTLAPGESILGRYALLRPPDAGPLPDRGAYRFDTAPWSDLELGLSLWDPDLAPKPISRFTDSGVSFPPTDGTVWFHRSYPDRPQVYVEPSRERVEFGDLTASFESYAAVPASVDRWGIAKAHDGAWRPIGPPERSGELDRVVAPGTTLQVGFTVDNDVRTATVNDPGSERPTVTGLRPGLYAVGVWADGTPESPTRDEPVRIDPDPARQSGDATLRSPPGSYAALFEFVGRPDELTPTEDAVVTGRENGVVTVDLTPSELEFDGGRRRKLVVVRGNLGKPRPLILEQVMQYPALRNALAYVDAGVKRVEVVTSPRLARQPVEFFGLDRVQGFEYAGEEFFASVEEPSEVNG